MKNAKIIVSFFVIVSILLPSVASAEAECREVYTDGIGWTNTFGMGRCDESEDDIGRLLAGVVVGGGLLWLMNGGSWSSDENEKLWDFSEPRDAVVGKNLYLPGGIARLKLIGVSPVKSLRYSRDFDFTQEFQSRRVQLNFAEVYIPID